MDQLNLPAGQARKKIKGCGFTTAIWGVVIIGGIIIGFFFLLRGCLSKWDTFGVIGWPGITKDEKSLVIVKSYSKTTSYEQKGGFTRKSYSTTYYLEKIDLATGKVTKKTKLMNHSKIKKGAMECFGGYNDRLWIFANYLRAYDMNTLEQVVKTEDIENKNPQLKGKMPVEAQYYDAHINLGYITITALDGDKYNLMLEDLHAELVDPKEENFEAYTADIKKQQDALEVRMDSLDEKYRGEDNYKNYEKLNDQRTVFYAMRDSLQRLEQNARDVFDYQQDIKRDLEDFDTFFSDDIGDWTINKDTMSGFGFLLEKDEPKDDRFDISNFSNVGSESDKVSIYKQKIELNPKSNSNWDRLLVKSTEAFKERYLQGGMMVDYRTARAYRTVDPGGYIIFSRDIIGNKGKLLVSRVSIDGKQLWQANTNMSFDLVFCMATKTHLIVGGIINPDEKPSFAGADGLRIIDLKTGSFVEVKY